MEDEEETPVLTAEILKGWQRALLEVCSVLNTPQASIQPLWDFLPRPGLFVPSENFSSLSEVLLE